MDTAHAMESLQWTWVGHQSQSVNTAVVKQLVSETVLQQVTLTTSDRVSRT